MNRLDAKTTDTFCLESTFSYLGEEKVDTSIEGTPVSDEVKENSKHKGVIGKIGGIGADSNEPTRNGRRYPIELWQNVEKSEYFIEGMENRSLIGEADHPQERLDYSVTEGAVVLTKYEIQNDGKVYTEFDILDTLPGRTVKTYFDAGCKLGVSSRGLGEEVMRNGEKIIDPDTYQFYCFDVVAFPAVKSARMELIESTSPKRESFIKSITKEINNCKSINELKFIESTAATADVYLDEIKEAVEIKKNSFEEDTISTQSERELPNPEDVSMTPISSYDDPEAAINSCKEMIADIDKLKSNATKADLWFKKVIQLQLDRYASEDDSNLTKTSENNNLEKSNKIQISDPEIKSDEDTTDDNKDSDLIVLAEIQEELKTKTNLITSLNKQLEQKTNVIKNLMSKSYNQTLQLQEAIDNSKDLTSNQQVEFLTLENKDLQNNIGNLKSELSHVKSKYEKLQKVNKEFSAIIESLNSKYLSEKQLTLTLQESVNNLNKDTKTLRSKNTQLTESLSHYKNDNDKISVLSESISQLKAENNQLKSTNESLRNDNQKHNSKLKNLVDEQSRLSKKYNESLDKYISVVCTKYNLNKSTLVRLLGENYDMKDIDKVAKELIENNSKINSLPFTNLVPDRQVVVENLGLEDSNENADENLNNFHFMLESKNN